MRYGDMIGTMESVMRQAEYFGMFTKISSNKQETIDNARTVSTSELDKDHSRPTQQGRNEPCECGSQKKFKKCCGKVIND